MLVEYYSDFCNGWCSGKVMAAMNNLDESIDQVVLALTKPPQGKEELREFIKEHYPQISIRSPLIREHPSWKNTTQHEEIELEEMNGATYPIPIGPERPGAQTSTFNQNKNKKSIQIKVVEYF